MRTTTLLLFLSLAFLASAEFSLIRYLLNHTKFDGNLAYKVKDGLGLNYNGTVSFNNGLINLDLAKLGIKFNANPDDTKNSVSDNGVHHHWNYDGAANVDYNGHNANVSVNGNSGVDATWEKDGDNAVNVHKTFSDHNTWSAGSDHGSAEGTSDTWVHADGHIEKDGDDITIHHDVVGSKVVAGEVSGSQHDGHFYSGKFGHVHGDGHVKLLKNGSQVDLSEYEDVKHAKPVAAFEGKASFEQDKRFVWNDDSWDVKEVGGANGKGVAFTHADGDDNNTFKGLGWAKKVEYGVFGGAEHNGEYAGNGHKTGTVKAVEGFGYKDYNNGTVDKGFVSAGKLDEKWVVHPHGGHKGNQSEPQHHEKEITGTTKAAWKHLSGARVQADAGKSYSVDFGSGTDFNVTVHDDTHDKEWKHEGKKLVHGHYDVDVENGQVGNFTMSVDSVPQPQPEKVKVEVESFLPIAV